MLLVYFQRGQFVDRSDARGLGLIVGTFLVLFESQTVPTMGASLD